VFYHVASPCGKFPRILVMTTPTPPTNDPPPLSTVEQPPYFRTLFLGPGGLRPGWGLLFYLLTFYLLEQFLDRLVAAATLHHALWSQLLDKFADLLAAIIPALVLVRIERRPWRSYGLPLKQTFRRPYWTGALWGFTALTLLVAALHVFHGYDLGHVILHGARLEKFAIYWAAMFLLVGLFEEFLFRGYTQFTLARGIGFWPAALIGSCAFAAVHSFNPGETPPGLAGVFAIGLFFCLTLRRTGSLWFAVGFHAAWDWGETFFYSVPDSGLLAPGHLLSSKLHGPEWLTGGSAGPEASVFCFAVIAVTSIAFARTHPAARMDSRTLSSPVDTQEESHSDKECQPNSGESQPQSGDVR
jgi:membrane protease YdiL (CAAX protease family)